MGNVMSTSISHSRCKYPLCVRLLAPLDSPDLVDITSVIAASISMSELSRRLSALACLVFSTLPLGAVTPASHPLLLSAKGDPGFTLVPPSDSGVDCKNPLTDLSGAQNRTLYNGSGVATGDFDGDGRPDIYVCRLEGENLLYRNLGNWKFEEVTREAGLSLLHEYSRGAVFADINGDGALDLLVAVHGHGVYIFTNDGRGHFTDTTRFAGTASQYGSVTLALADVEGDGDLDLYVTNNRRDDYRDQPKLQMLLVNGKLVVPSQVRDRFTVDENGAIQEYGEPDALYLNDGKGRFTPVSWTDGAFLDEDGKPLTRPPLDWGLTAQFRDINDDGAPDLYVCNDYWTPDRIYLNDGKGRFRAIDRLALRSISASSMGVDFADIDRDGHVDFMVVDMLSRDHQRRKRQLGAMKAVPRATGAIDDRPQVMRNTLFHARGDGTFEEIANFAGLAASEWSWQPLFLDVDLDGFEDLLITTGHARDVQDADMRNKIDELKRTNQLVPDAPFSLDAGSAIARHERHTAELLAMSQLRPRLDTGIIALRNKGDLTFEEKNWGTGQLGVHHGIATADFDGDGDLDFVVNNLNSVVGLYRNNASAPRVAVRLRGGAGNTQGIGAKVVLHDGAVSSQSQEVISGGRYAAGSDPQLCFAAGASNIPMMLEVTWRSGRRSIVRGVKQNTLVVVEESTAEPVVKPPPAPRRPLFTDVSTTINHSHHENSFDDFARQSLLPNRLSQLGPGVTWCDLNGDGNDDLIVGSGAGGAPGVFLGDGKGGFGPLQHPAFGKTSRDQTSILAFGPSADATTVLIGLTHFEDGKEKGLSVIGAPEIPVTESATGPLALADVDGDGALDLFVGGRSIPGRYPAPASSNIYLRKNGKFVRDEKASAALKEIGLVSAAVFSDLNADGAPDLILALEWGPVTVFMNDRAGGFANRTDEFGLTHLTGWWNGVATGDFNEDGLMDIVATNWGRNSKYAHQYDAQHPMRVHWGDFNGDGVTQVIESHYDSAMNKFVPERGFSCSSMAMPFIKEITPTYAAFGSASVEEIYGRKLASAPSMTARTLDHTLFLNRGDRFEPVALPIAAQLSPGFGVSVGDLDGDGHEDLFMAQNFFAAQIETPRIDAGLGIILKGDGRGGLSALSALESGIRVWGDARSSALGDFDRDGRLDLAVSQNGAGTKLFHNDSARAGVRVRLAGPDGNSTGVGAQIRLISGKKNGPIREVRAGSGYWSQDTAWQVVTKPDGDATLWVRWPGGKETMTALPATAREVTASPDGRISVTAERAPRATVSPSR